jgi:nucleotide-binding universal stress UspA family protein
MARLAPAEHRRIVVAVSDSEESVHATAVAAQLVAQKGELVFVHVIEVPLEFELSARPPEDEEAARRDANELLGRCQALAERYGVSSKRVLERQHAAGPAIVDAAARVGASLIVIAGDQRFSRAGRLRLGSTSTHVLKHAGCCVMVISAQAAVALPAAQVA